MEEMIQAKSYPDYSWVADLQAALMLILEPQNTQI